VSKEKGTEPFRRPIFGQPEKERVERRIEEARERADHYQDFEADDEVKHNCAVKERFALTHLTASHTMNARDTHSRLDSDPNHSTFATLLVQLVGA